MISTIYTVEGKRRRRSQEEEQEQEQEQEEQEEDELVCFFSPCSCWNRKSLSKMGERGTPHILILGPEDGIVFSFFTATFAIISKSSFANKLGPPWPCLGGPTAPVCPKLLQQLFSAKAEPHSASVGGIPTLHIYQI
jgi:hypothetical protein